MRRRGDGLSLFAVGADAGVQGDVYGRAAGGVLSGSGGTGLCDAVRGVSSALRDEYAADLASRAAGRMLAHNGEINTVWGNRARMAARDSTLPVECKPVADRGRDRLDQPG